MEWENNALRETGPSSGQDLWDLIPNTAAEALRRWDEGKPVFTLEMGGLGPGYEQAIHVLVFEIIRDNLSFDPDNFVPHHFGEAAVARVSKSVGGLSDAQVGAAKSLALAVLLDGWHMTISRKSIDRQILVSRFWPSFPSF